REGGLGGVSLTAEGQAGGEHNGYYSWARLGADGPVPEKARAALPPEFRGAKTVQDVMALPGGPAAWKQHGRTFEATFDLDPGSRSSRVLAAYLGARGLPALAEEDWAAFAAASAARAVGEKWQGPSGKWFTKRQDGRVVPTSAPEQEAAAGGKAPAARAAPATAALQPTPAAGPPGPSKAD